MVLCGGVCAGVCGGGGEVARVGWVEEGGGLAPLWFLVLWDVLPGVLAVGLWLVEGVVPVGLLLVGLSGVMVCVDVVAVLRNEFAQVGVLVLALLVFAGCNMGFAQWNRVRVGYDKAGLLVERCECEEGWFLPSADWSVGLYVDGVLVRSEGRHRFLPRMDELAGGGGGVYRLNRMETEYFVFERGEGTFVVSRSGWTDVVTSFTNVTMLFFIYVAMVLGGYWVWFVARRRVLVRRSFFARLRISLLFFLLAGLLVVFLLTVGFVGYRYARNAKSGLEGVMMVLVDHVTPMLGGGGDVGGVLDVVERVSELYNTEVSIYDGLGHLVFTSDTLHVVHNITAWRNNPFEGMESAVETKVEFGYGRKMRVQSYGLIMTGAGETYYAVMWSESDMARMRSELSFSW